MTINGIIISLTPYKESGAIVNIMCEDYMRSFYAPNIYKINKDNLLLTTSLIYGSFTFKESNKKFLTYKEMTPILDTRTYMNDLTKLIALNFINETILKIINNEDYPKIYPFLLEILLAMKNVAPLSLMLLFLATALRFSGSGLNVDNCVITGSQYDIVGVSYHDGGFISRKVYQPLHHKKYSPNQMHILREIFKMKPSYINKINYDLSDVKTLFNDLLVYTYDQTGHRYKCEKMIAKTF